MRLVLEIGLLVSVVLMNVSVSVKGMAVPIEDEVVGQYDLQSLTAESGRMKRATFSCYTCSERTHWTDPNKCSVKKKYFRKACSNRKATMCSTTVGLEENCQVTVVRGCAEEELCQHLEDSYGDDCENGLLMRGKTCGKCCDFNNCNRRVQDFILLESCGSKKWEDTCNKRDGRQQLVQHCRMCNGTEYRRVMEQRICPSTTTAPPTTTTVPTTTTTRYVETCIDELDHCETWANFGLCEVGSSLYELVITSCKRSCQLCEPKI